MGEKKGFMNTLQKFILPIGNFLSNQRHFSSVSAGLQATVGVSVIGAFMQIFQAIINMFGEGGLIASSLGIQFSWTKTISAILDVPYNMTIGMMSIITAFAIAYNLAKHYKLNQMTCGIVSIIMFVMVVAPVQTVVLSDGVTTFTGLDSTWLGAPGLFTSIITSLLSVEIFNLCVKYNLVIKMPDVIPPFLQDSFTSMIPLLMNVIVIYGINALLNTINPALNIATAITAILMTPISSIVGSVPGMIIIGVFALLLWTVGVHGTAIVMPIVIPVMIEAYTKNAALVAAGGVAEFNPVFLFGTIAVAGTGNTLALSVLCQFKAKSEQLKAIGKVSTVPGIFGVNESMIFGVPIAFNPFMAIPFILQGLVVMLLQYIAYSLGIISAPHILIMSLMPVGVGGFLSTMNWKNFAFSWINVVVAGLVYYPFFKIYDKQLVEQEKEKKIA